MPSPDAQGAPSSDGDGFHAQVWVRVVRGYLAWSLPSTVLGRRWIGRAGYGLAGRPRSRGVTRATSLWLTVGRGGCKSAGVFADQKVLAAARALLLMRLRVDKAQNVLATSPSKKPKTFWSMVSTIAVGTRTGGTHAPLPRSYVPHHPLMTHRTPDSDAPLVLVIQHESECPIGLWKTWLTESGLRLHIVHPYFEQALPESLERYDGLLVLGGTPSPWEDGLYPWLPATRALLHAGVTGGTPTFGICLGAELMVVALGGSVERRSTPQVGMHNLNLLPAAASDPVFMRPA